MQAYAVAITEENMNVIASEAGPGFNLATAKEWLREHESGYFLRDPGSALDCQFFEEIVFFEMYAFQHSDHGTLFKRVVHL